MWLRIKVFQFYCHKNVRSLPESATKELEEIRKSLIETSGLALEEETKQSEEVSA
jgi:hypothetical protein